MGKLKKKIINGKGVSECYLTPNQQFFSYIMARKS